jgi:hypothetical protein
MSASALFVAMVLAASPPASIDRPATPDLRPRLVVEDARQLPRLMAGDPVFSGQAQALERRQTLSWVAGGLGVAAFLGFTFASMGSMSASSPDNASAGPPREGVTYALVGVASLAVGSLVAVALHPKRGEVVDLVNGWNLAHPEKPLELQPVVVAPAYVPLD